MPGYSTVCGWPSLLGRPAGRCADRSDVTQVRRHSRCAYEKDTLVVVVSVVVVTSSPTALALVLVLFSYIREDDLYVLIKCKLW